MPRSAVLLSGGLDSAVSLAHALRESEVALCLTFNYGQHAAQKEIEAAANLTAYYHLPHQVVELPFLGEITGTALVKNEASLPEPELALLDDPVAATASAVQVWVPNRNGLFINIAAAFAEACGAGLVVCGFNREEAATFPDNGADFVRAANSALSYSTLNDVKVVSYTQLLSKADIIKLGLRHHVPFQYIWSCYRGGEKMCGRCESCLRFKRAAQEADLDLEQIAFQEV
ncbi:MAG: 7-cyano-7-deazaguanine synthase [Pelotomaculum sp. PtaB.Bin104]|nr:MAG: 7-cyano-7-deazaguanine synthase [Pelotomaculum sp. PtaB.Bin104]